VESVSASARLRLELGPLEGKLPLVPQIALSLVDFPQLGFDLTLYGGDVTLLPGLESFLSAVLRDFVIRPFVLPGRFVLDLPGGGGEEAALGFDRPRGMLFVTVEEAARVPRVDLFSAADCYVKVGTTGGGRRKKKKGNEREESSKERELLGNWSRTRTIPNHNSPRWDQELRPLLVRDPENEAVDFVLMDADEMGLGGDDEIGRCSVKVSAVVAALKEREEEEEQRRRRRRQGRRGVERPPSPVRRPEVAEEREEQVVSAAAASGGEEEEDGGFVVVGRNHGTTAASAVSVSVPSASASASSAPAAPVTDRSGGEGEEFFERKKRKSVRGSRSLHLKRETTRKAVALASQAPQLQPSSIPSFSAKAPPSTPPRPLHHPLRRAQGRGDQEDQRRR
jgi:hypothetical protein